MGIARGQQIVSRTAATLSFHEHYVQLNALSRMCQYISTLQNLGDNRRRLCKEMLCCSIVCGHLTTVPKPVYVRSRICAFCKVTPELFNVTHVVRGTVFFKRWRKCEAKMKRLDCMERVVLLATFRFVFCTKKQYPVVLCKFVSVDTVFRSCWYSWKVPAGPH